MFGSDESLVIGLVLVALGCWMVSGKFRVPDQADPNGTKPLRGQQIWRQDSAFSGWILIAFGVTFFVVPLLT